MAAAAAMAARRKSSPNVIPSRSEVDRRRSELAKSSRSHAATTTTRTSGGSLTQTLNGLRLGFTADQLLPNYNRRRSTDAVRAASVDVSPTDAAKVLLAGGEEGRHGRTRSASLQPSVSFTLLRIDDDYLLAPPPPEDDELNAKMELLYEQYRDIERGVLSKRHPVDKNAAAATAAAGNATRPQTAKKPAMQQKGRSGSQSLRSQASPYRPLSRSDAVEMNGERLHPQRTICSSGTSNTANRPGSSPLERGRLPRKDFTPETKGQNQGHMFISKTPRSSSDLAKQSV